VIVKTIVLSPSDIIENAIAYNILLIYSVYDGAYTLRFKNLQHVPYNVPKSVGRATITLLYYYSSADDAW
jgi:hypothetical protein